MKTRTIYSACNIAERRWQAGYCEVAERQFRLFERELLRRMDERDKWDALRKMNTVKTVIDTNGNTAVIAGKWSI